MKKLLKMSNIGKAFLRPVFAAYYLKGKIKAHIGYRFGRGYSLFPGKVFLAITGRCNLRCSMCPQYNHPSFQNDIVKEGEVNFKELRRIIDDISSFRPIILVSGGELFLHPSWRDFLSYVKSRGLFCSIGSNGTLVSKHASQLVDIGLNELSVSIDGPEHVHDKIRGVPGAFAKSVEGIKRVVKERDRVGAKKPFINVIFTITPENYKYIHDMIALLDPLKINTFRIGHLNFLRQKDYEDHMNMSEKLFGIDQDTSWAGFISESHNIDARYLADTIDDLRAAKSRNLKITFFPNFSRNEIIQYYSDQDFHSTSFKNACFVPWDLALIGPKGEVIMCPNYIIGNLREKSFKEIWNNENARHFRKVILKKKELPACSRGCCFFYY
jgi:radical SAM protein with 4Fe4S-binding SPASM domain